MDFETAAYRFGWYGRSDWLRNPTRRDQPMHYRDGRPAENGDIVVQIGGYGDTAGTITAVGVLHGAIPGNDHCNGSIAPIQNPVTSACLADCLHVETVRALLKDAGLDKRAEGK